MHPVARGFAANAVAGALVGLLVLALLLLPDPLGLRPLLARDELGTVLTVVLAMQFAAGFGVFAAATGLFLLEKEPERQRSGGRAPNI